MATPSGEMLTSDEYNPVITNLLSGVTKRLALADAIPIPGEAIAEQLQDYFNLFEIENEIDPEDLELSRLATANRIYGWRPTNEALNQQWRRLRATYKEINDSTSIPCALIEVNEGAVSSHSPMGDFISASSDAILLDKVLITKSKKNYFLPNLGSEITGYGTGYLGGKRKWPHRSVNLDGRELLLSVLESKATGKTMEVQGDLYGNSQRIFYIAAGAKAVAALPDHMASTGRYAPEVLLEQFGRLGLPVRQSDLYRNFDFNPEQRHSQKMELIYSLTRALLGDMGIMPEEVRKDLALFGLDPQTVLAETEENYAQVHELAPWLRHRNLPDRFRYEDVNSSRQPDGRCVRLQAYNRGHVGFDRELIAHVLGIQLGPEEIA